jgi:hypothetical protein
MGEPLTLEKFAPHVGTTFTVQSGDVDLPLELVEAVGLPASPGDRGRQPFSLVFAGPADSLHPQATVELTHDVLGSLAIFIVPIARDASSMRYEAIFT